MKYSSTHHPSKYMVDEDENFMTLATELPENNQNDGMCICNEFITTFFCRLLGT